MPFQVSQSGGSNVQIVGIGYHFLLVPPTRLEATSEVDGFYEDESRVTPLLDVAAHTCVGIFFSGFAVTGC